MAAAALQGAVKAALFKSPAARSMALSAVQTSVAQRVTALTTSSADKIDWTAYNWPHPSVGLLHFDMAELAAKRPLVYPTVRLLFWWCIAVVAAQLLNLVDSLVLVSLVHGGAYSKLAPFFSVLSFLSLSSAAFTVLRAWYHGAAENAGRSKTVARALLCMLCFFWLLFALLPSGNVLGVAGFAQAARHEQARDGGTAPGAMAFWFVATAIESLVYAGLLGWSSYLVWLLFAQPVPAA